MMKGFTIFLMGVLFTELKCGVLDVQTTTPFCQLCSCHLQPNQQIWIDCTSKNIHDIYNPTFWFDNSNNKFQIENITLPFNELTSLTTVFPQSHLKILDLSHNSIKEIASATFGQLQDLVVLNLSNNEISNLLPDTFEGIFKGHDYYPLRSLKVLNLRHNQLRGLQAENFVHISQMEELDLSFNPICVIDDLTAEAIGKLSSLITLGLSFAQLETLPIFFLRPLTRLTNLDLSGNCFISLPIALQHCSSLKSLNFNENNLANIYRTPNVTTLRSLHVSHMPFLESVGPRSFAGFSNLERLHMRNNERLTKLNGNAFLVNAQDKWYLPLTELYVDNNNLTVFKQTLLPKWNGLNALVLGGNPWRCDCYNYWLITSLVPLLNTEERLQNKCATPSNWEGVSLYELFQKSSRLWCGSAMTNLEFALTILLVIFFTFVIIAVGLFWKPVLLKMQYFRLRNNRV